MITTITHKIESTRLSMMRSRDEKPDYVCTADDNDLLWLVTRLFLSFRRVDTSTIHVASTSRVISTSSTHHSFNDIITSPPNHTLFLQFAIHPPQTRTDKQTAAVVVSSPKMLEARMETASILKKLMDGTYNRRPTSTHEFPRDSPYLTRSTDRSRSHHRTRLRGQL